ncbi:hypothetical protein HJA87_30580 [Rhizobium bangladeshense]|uniref:Uncharacterized protein n=1 Tax=Rhizobium bangladeshense TaxID=1138189 RepID=A0ABS7LSD8_9HYPH|nr:hypothetical protein [Rhizobium bangladeshense]MBY3594178.1 hypothetical protein [Rhizobium bangladeshense]
MKEMRAFFAAVLMAMLKLVEGGIKGFEWCWQRFLGLLPGGGGGGTVMPPKRLDLPDVDDAHQAKAEAADQQRAADYMLSSPERVALAWARASKEDRDTIPLTKLTTDQIDWLEVRLTDDQLKILASEKSEYKVAAALAGQEGAIFGVPSVPARNKKSGPGLSDRIMDFRAGGIERPPAYVH